jgi:bacteriocin biosynthesis cyclodehydratase domain-containing protein
VQGGDGPAEADVTVLTHDHEPGAETVARLLRDGRPHLVVGVRGVDGVVGPLVLPGTTCCLRCVDLCRAAGDPGWAGLREQLAAPAPVSGAIAVPASAVTTTALAALAAADVLALLEGRRPATLGATVTLSLHRPLPTVRSWPAHPACGCTWDAHTSGRGQWSA